MQRDHVRQLTAQQNAKLRLTEDDIAAGQQQVVLMVTLPFGSTEQTLGPTTISSVRDAKVHFRIASLSDPKSWAYETTASFSRDKALAQLYYLGALRLAHSKLMAITADEEQTARVAADNAARAQTTFVEGVDANTGERADWTQCFIDSSGSPNNLWPVFFEEIPTKTKDRIEACRVWMVVRGREVEQDLIDAAEWVEKAMRQWYLEEKTHISRLGYFKDKLTDNERKEIAKLREMSAPVAQEGDPQAEPANNDQQQGTLDGFVRRVAPLPPPPPQIQELPDEPRERGVWGADRAVWKHYGWRWDDSVSERRDNLQSLLTCWQFHTSSLVKPHFWEAGHTRAELEPFFSHFWEGDKLSFSLDDLTLYEKRISHSLAGKKHDLDEGDDDDNDDETLFVDPRVLRAERGHAVTGLVVPAFVNLDYQRLGTFDRTTRVVKQIQPAHFFPPHALTNWITHEADTVQAFVANYFTTDHKDNQKVSSGLKFGLPTENLHALFCKHVQEASLRVRSTLKHGAMSYATLSALLVGTIQSPVDLGEKFKGFPYPERVTVLSPELGHPWSLPLVPVQFLQNPTHPWTKLQKFLDLAIPSNAQSLELYQKPAVRHLLFGRGDNIRRILRRPRFFTSLRPHLRQILRNRMAIRYAATVSVGMFREWGIKQSTSLPSVGKNTMQQRISGKTFKDPFDLLAKEEAAAAADTLSFEDWDRLLITAEECLKTRMLHLRKHIGSEQAPIEISHFVKFVRRTMSVIPWRSAVTVVDTAKRELRLQANKNLLDILNGGSGDTMNLDRNLESNTFSATTWSHRQLNPGGRGNSSPGDEAMAQLLKISRAQTVTGASVPAHGGWKMCGDIAEMLETENIIELRRADHWGDFVGDYHAKLQDFVTKIGLPYRFYASKFGTHLEGREIARAALQAVSDVEDFSLTMIENHSRVIFAEKHPYAKNQATRNVLGASLPEAFAGVLEEWQTTYGLESIVSQIPYKACINGYENIRQSAAAMVAFLDDTFKEMNLGLHGMTYMLSAAHLVFSAMMTSCVMSTDRDKLGQLHLIFPGSTASGKSTMVHAVLALFISKTYTDMGSFSAHAMQARQDCDGLAIYFDEAVESFMSDNKDKVNGEVLSFIKRMLTFGSDSRLVLVLDDGDRYNQFVDSSHRRLIIACVNTDPSKLDPAIQTRFTIRVMRSYQSPETQPLAEALPARSGQGVAADDRKRGERRNEKTIPCKVLHALKVILEMMIHQGMLSVDVTSMTEYATFKIAPFKKKIPYQGKMGRKHQDLTLLLRSNTVLFAAWQVAQEFYRRKEILKEFSSHSHIPYEFVLREGRKHLFCTKAVADYCISILFPDIVDSPVHSDLLQFFVHSKMLKADVENNLHLKREITPSVDDTDADHVGGDIDEHPKMNLVQWSTSRLAQKRHRYALDMNYVPIVFDAKNFKAACRDIAGRMETVRYPPEAISAAIWEMCNSRFVFHNGCGDLNCLHAMSYDQKVSNAFTDKLMQNGQNAYKSDQELKAEAQRRMQAWQQSRDHAQQTNPYLGPDGAPEHQNQQHDDRDRDRDRDGGFGAKNRESGDVGVTTYEEAVMQGMPLYYYRTNTRAPVARMGQLGNGKFYIAFHRSEVEYIERTFASEDSGDYPISSTLISTLDQQLNATSPKLPMPAQIQLPPNGKLEEMIVTSYSLNTNPTYVKTRVERVAKTIQTQTNGKIHPALGDFLIALGPLLENQGCVLTAPAPIIVKHELDNTKTRKVVMTYQNESASHATTRYLDFKSGLEHLRDEDCPSFGSFEFTSDAANMLINSDEGYLRRLIALNNDWLRREYKIDQDIRHVFYDADWDSFVQYCQTHQPALDPMDPKNHEALPLIWLQKRRNELLATLGDKETTSAIFPLQSVEHQLKRAIFKMLVLRYCENTKFARKFHPDAHPHSTLQEWMASAVDFLSNWLELTAPVAAAAPPPRVKEPLASQTPFTLAKRRHSQAFSEEDEEEEIQVLPQHFEEIEDVVMED